MELVKLPIALKSLENGDGLPDFIERAVNNAGFLLCEAMPAIYGQLEGKIQDEDISETVKMLCEYWLIMRNEIEHP